MLYCTLVYSLCNFIQITRKCSCTYKQAKIRCSKAQIRIRKNFMFILCLLDRASSWQLSKERPTWCHLLYYFLLNAQHVSDVNTSETCWALSKEIIKQVTSSWSLFTQLTRMNCCTECITHCICIALHSTDYMTWCMTPNYQVHWYWYAMYL